MTRAAATLSPPQPLRAPDVHVRVELTSDRAPHDWDAYVDDHPRGSFFHATAWMESVRTAFHHQILYAVARRGDACTGVLPLACVKSWIAGTMLVSVPYGVYGGVLSDDQQSAGALLNAARNEARSRNARCIDLRSESASFDDVTRIDRYVTFRRDLPDDAGAVLKWLPRKARAAARNARTKFGLAVRFDDDQLPLVWSLYSRSMHRLASLNYPYRFFEELVQRSPERHLVSVVYDGQHPVAGLLSFIHNRTVMPYFVGSTHDAHRCNAFNLIYLSLAERAIELGLRTFDFGRSRRDNQGCVNFKRFQGFEPTPLGYQCDVMPGQRPQNLTPSNPRFNLARKVWPRLPRSITTPLGAWLSRHVPG